MTYCSYFQGNEKQGAVLATDIGICRVILPGDEEALLSLMSQEAVSSPLTDEAAGLLSAYYNGEKISFSALPVDLCEVTPFRARILTLIRAIEQGEVKSYGEVAAMAGAPRAARAIGGAMAANPVPIIIPCHRIVAGNGSLTGFSAVGGISVKSKLLRMEGIEFKGDTTCKMQRLLTGKHGQKSEALSSLSNKTAN